MNGGITWHTVLAVVGPAAARIAAVGLLTALALYGVVPQAGVAACLDSLGLSAL